MSVNLNPEKALLFRICHVENVEWILSHGLHCAGSGRPNPQFVSIGKPELIDKRKTTPVPIPPGGMLGDYVPFYFTPYSPMLLNIKTGYGGITQRTNREIVIFVSSIHQLHARGVPFVFTNRHACSFDVEFFNDPQDLHRIDWPLLQSRNFKTDDADPGKQARYQAEALVHREVPLPGLRGIVCHEVAVKQRLDAAVAQRGLSLEVKALPNWYF